ncbi:MAG: PDZ domain-containing protein [Helicobacteraceae bacterium]|jgi:hypothetical protein|nr:PDZ domain-containing protein [Helicobacteraceae bacterium]
MSLPRSIVAFVAYCAFAFAALGEEFAPCAEKNRLAYARERNLVGVAIDADRLLVPLGLLSPNKLPKAWSLERYDPLSGLAIVRAKHNLIPIVFRKADRVTEHKNLLLMNENEAIAIPVSSVIRQLGATPARVAARSQSASLLTAPCYAVVGVSTLGAIIESDFIERFIASEAPFYWGDLGFRLEDFNVSSVDPFITNNPFKRGDRIKALGGAVYETPEKLARAILFLRPNDETNISIERGGEEITLSAKVSKRLGGFLVADTFLERFGLVFNRDLFVRSVDNNRLSVRAGDRLVSVNGEIVKTSAEARGILTGHSGAVRLLMQRGDFQFFIAIEAQTQ